MKRELRITRDGSHTIYVHELDEPYHSIHGSIQESRHVYINEGFRKTGGDNIRILECGFGTGLNLLLTIEAAGVEERKVFYHTVEKFPLTREEYSHLNFESLITGLPPHTLVSIHEEPWNQPFNLQDRITVFKEQADFRNMAPKGSFDLVYFDAFAPDKQPDLWSFKVFSKIYQLMKPLAILVTYTSKGTVRRTLSSCGFQVDKIPGPPGKREMIRASKR